MIEVQAPEPIPAEIHRLRACRERTAALLRRKGPITRAEIARILAATAAPPPPTRKG